MLRDFRWFTAVFSYHRRCAHSMTGEVERRLKSTVLTRYQASWSDARNISADDVWLIVWTVDRTFYRNQRRRSSWVRSYARQSRNHSVWDFHHRWPHRSLLWWQLHCCRKELNRAMQGAVDECDEQRLLTLNAHVCWSKGKSWRSKLHGTVKREE